MAACTPECEFRWERTVNWLGAGRVVVRNRGRALIAASAVAVALAVVAVSHPAAASIAGLLKVRLGGDAQQTRLVMDLDQAATGKLMADGVADGHVVLLLSNVSAQGGLSGNGQGLVKAWSIVQTSGGARLQIDLAPDARIKGRFLLPPADGVDHYRYVVDVAAQPGGPIRMTSTPVDLTSKLRPQIVSAHIAPIS